MSKYKRKNRKTRALTDLFKIVLIFGLFCFGVVVFWITTFDVPDLKSFEERKVLQSTKIYDNTGEILLYEFNNNDIKRSIVEFDEISRHIKNATIAIEDAEFYDHHGIKPRAIIRAVFVNLTSLEFSQGGSTITQQAIKNSVLIQDKKISRKLKEWVLALRLEQIISKEAILTLYLNEVPYGGSVYGVREATQLFFGKEPNEVTLAESAYIAAIPQAPTFYSPYGSNTDRLEVRKNLVLEKMLENGFITEEQYEEAKDEDVEFKPRATLGIRAPHFVFFISEYLENKYGSRVLEEGGLSVTTTLDYSLQEKAEEIVKRYALSNEENFNASNASLVAVEPETGHIKVMVGSRDYFDEEIDGNFNVAVSHRQPGSAFKPFVYATAFKKGYTPETAVFDVETEFSTECSPDSKPLRSDAVCYRPGNYDGNFQGPITLRNALAQSVNIPAIKALYLAGLNSSLRTARDMGIESLTNVDQYGLTLVLGGGEVSPLEISSAYSVFANDGIRNEPTGVIRIEDSNGNVLEEYKKRSTRALDENVARLISDVLSDNEARTPAFGANSPLYFPNRDVAAKTGTTNDYRDAWTVGYTPNLAVAAWAGNNDNSSMDKKVAGFIITPLWREFMDVALSQIEDKRFKIPETVKKESLPPQLRGVWQGGLVYTVDQLSGGLATEFTPEETKQEKVVFDPHTILHWVDKDNPQSGDIPNNPSDKYSQYDLWEYAVSKWVADTNLTREDESVIPNFSDNLHTKNSQPRLVVSGLSTTYSPGSRISFSVTNQNSYPLRKIEVFFNNKYIGEDTTAPFSFSFTPDNPQENNTLMIIGTDSIYNQEEFEYQIPLQ